ncbi:MAG: hypothetical protein IPI38_19055 [Gemmatimonadetes bacterium]|nr:hypothetical protein [Gemmatimonadota bacterium]MBK7352010.1 hypothetical protein [Gemmatimonadota bacterium]MBK7717472.1 hypothetical protein [Gemmatimonadota bacterium]MBK7784953.1 hypothetical protein [Gemmatimonadota bacterium]MBK9693757.1 hypothetical protein [Gemmatimonadota bacterium]
MYRLVTDHLGSVRAVVDTAIGAVVQWASYDAWGNVLADSGAGFQPFGFAGGLTDGATGLVRFGVRDCDPTIGRWTAKDPVGFAGGYGSLYSYVGSSPVGRTDITGLCIWDGCLVEFIGLSVAAAAAIQAGFEALCGGDPTRGAIAGAKTGLALSTIAASGVLGAGAALPLALGPSVSADHIVLGLAEHGLADVAALVGGRRLGAEFIPELQRALLNPAARITVSVEGMSGGNIHDQVMGAAMRGLSQSGGFTDFEMGMLYQAGRLSQVTFVNRGGQVLPNPFAP